LSMEGESETLSKSNLVRFKKEVNVVNLCGCFRGSAGQPRGV
jgi:hypothetical protein